ncbi:DUF397 domain-containing protein [Nocardia cyriacigeorgica]|uniref:DUF397 domain-containing protein n=1 Tax=Nocardia cyriacigeorgica TaxID=135487 RepID=UPI0018940EE2|nr:DUF397 domain-containing protein [Nocardia cyriacigeorgica]MBF6428034.1 DUF397 domain-containing protein [Nocardia cyriacigeorgica]
MHRLHEHDRRGNYVVQVQLRQGGGQLRGGPFRGESVLMRDSKYLRAPGVDPVRQPVIEMPAARWGEFLDSVVDGESSAATGLPVVARGVDGVVVSFGGVSLRFTWAEWEAFVSGIAVGEFAAA